MTREQAIEIATSGITEEWTDFQCAVSQLCEERMIVPSFSRFHGALENELGYPIWTHEFAHRPTLHGIMV